MYFPKTLSRKKHPLNVVVKRSRVVVAIRFRNQLNIFITVVIHCKACMLIFNTSNFTLI